MNHMNFSILHIPICTVIIAESASVQVWFIEEPFDRILSGNIVAEK